MARARAPLGPFVTVDLGMIEGPLGELAEILSEVNGFTVFNAGIQVFRAGSRGLGPDLQTWNDPRTWRHSYADLAERLFCFAQDLLGVQFAIVAKRQVVAFDPETGGRTVLGDSLNAWAEWLLADPAVRGAYGLATAWQHQRGPLSHDQRLIPLQFFTLGGSHDFANLVAKDAAECMRIRGPLAQCIHDLPDGMRIRLRNEQDDSLLGTQ